jgi:hypothetical protein
MYFWQFVAPFSVTCNNRSVRSTVHEKPWTDFFFLFWMIQCFAVWLAQENLPACHTQLLYLKLLQL